MAEESWVVSGPQVIEVDEVRSLRVQLVAGRVDVVTHDEPGARVEVHDVGPPVQAPPEPGGHGLVGIRERVALYGGSVDLGSSPSGGVRLAVSLPLEVGT